MELVPQASKPAIPCSLMIVASFLGVIGGSFGGHHLHVRAAPTAHAEIGSRR